MNTIIIFLSVDWGIFSRRPALKALAENAGKHGIKVIAVNRPLCPFTTLQRKPARVKELFRRSILTNVSDGLWLYSPKYFIHDIIADRSGLLSKLNILALRRSFKSLAGRLSLDLNSPVVWYYYPLQGYVTRLFTGSFNVFELYDSLADVSGELSDVVAAQEVKFRPEVDLLVTTSQVLFDQYHTFYKNALISGNGLTRKAYEKLSNREVEPNAELMKIPSPRVGYAGVISDRLDFGLVVEIANKLPHISFIFVGRSTPTNLSDRFAGIRNLFFVDAVSEEEVPSVIAGFDLGWLPYRDTTFFEALNPLKFYELLAAGKQIVSSRIPELARFGPEVVELCKPNSDDWVDALKRRLESSAEVSSKVAGPRIAANYLWEEMTEKLLMQLLKLCGDANQSRTAQGE